MLPLVLVITKIFFNIKKVVSIINGLFFHYNFSDGKVEPDIAEN